MYVRWPLLEARLFVLYVFIDLVFITPFIYTRLSVYIRDTLEMGDSERNIPFQKKVVTFATSCVAVNKFTYSI